MSGSDLLVIKYILELPSAIECPVVLNEITYVVICDDFFFVIVDQASELGVGRVLLLFLGKALLVCGYALNDLGSKAGAILLGR